ncbi:MAG: tRNA (N6-isopentenyl adenosine(37)-C2)-methylthiotransferase MiaB, partial [Clostridia bacterium]|nr:tRNA (N6-isopentenyl adenosine(37)-C2)-methylthiotransferase MiaB [Clostridia bacterium]
MQRKYFINTYGCQMNVHESEKLAGILIERGYTQADSLNDADIVVFNTCCVRETAEQRVLGNLGIVKKLKESKPNLKVAVCGCMAQKKGSAESLKKRCPFINIIFGTHNIHKFGEFLDELDRGVKFQSEILDTEGKIVEGVPVYRTSGVNAWVNISYGCNNFCSYCIVPYVRGRERSRSKSQIIDDVRALLDEGYKEITLLGQNVNSYGNDFADKSINFANLLEELSKFDGKYKIRFMTSHPKDLSEDVVKVIASSDKLADFIHLPVQAGSDRILSLMNRKYTKSDYLKQIDMIRKHIPNVGLSSDIMVGFPTETEEDFLDTVDIVKRVRYNNLFTFIYSRRSGTPADKMEQIPLAIKKDRIKRLIDLQFEIGNEEASACVGKTYETLCAEFHDGKCVGKSSCEKAITFT